MIRSSHDQFVNIVKVWNGEILDPVVMELGPSQPGVPVQHRGHRLPLYWGTVPPREKHLRVEQQGTQNTPLKVIKVLSSLG